MKIIKYNLIKNTVCDMFLSANRELGEKETILLKNACKTENTEISRSVMGTILDNLTSAREDSVPICQDTGMAVVFAEIGCEVSINGGLFTDAVNEGVKEAYSKGYFRASVVSDPLFDRINTKTNTPAVIYTETVSGDALKITVVPKGFGSENKSALMMMKPTSDKEDVIEFILNTVINAGSGACPPYFIGIGIGGTFEYAPFLAKKALARGAGTSNKDTRYASLEKELLDRINLLNIGPQGFGGLNTALGVNIEWYPTHIAGLPVAVNMCCHVMRHKCAII